MKLRRTLFGAVALVLCVPVGAAAQDYRFDLGINGGGSWFSHALDEDHLLQDSKVKFEQGWLVGAQGTFWVVPRVGLRANFGYTDRPLQYERGEGVVGGLPDDTELLSHVNLWTGTGDLMLRFAGTPAETFTATEFLPFIALGLGAKWVNAAGPEVALTNGDSNETGAVFTVNDRSFFVEEQTELVYRAALGTDVRVSPNLGFRFEVGDMIWDAPFELVNATNGGFARIDQSEEDIGETQHELYATAGVHLMLGLRAAPEVAVLPPPSPPAQPSPRPEPEPMPEPEPEPVEESVTFCLIDPSGPAGTRTVTAVYRPLEGDTLIVEDGARVALESRTAGMRLAGGEDWFIAGRPLVVEYGNRRVEFVPYGGARTVEEHLVVIGTVDGLPVYASSQDAMAFRTSSAAGPTTDLEMALTDNPELRTNLEGLTRLYVPVQPVGCVFGPLQRMEEVRK